MYDPQVEALSQRSWYPGKSASQLDYVARVPIGLQSAVRKIGPWPMKTVTLNQYSVPPVGQKTNQVYAVHKQQRSAMSTAPGAAPQSGIYNGIPSGCNPNMGGNPFS